MKKLFVVLFYLVPAISFAQKENKLNVHNYPQNYFLNPLDIPIYLAGNFGECRPGHFHSGIDIKTEGKENQPVHAAADGYISRIKMEKGGFGHAIYITHPNGYTTLYAHLNKFAPAIQKYVRSKQYEKENWAVDLQFEPSQFPVKKGQQIAWSGNTGASTAPHLHFEIRNSQTEHPLNPEMFGLPIIDMKAPIVNDIAIYDMEKSIYEQDPRILPVSKKGNYYTLKDTVSVANTNVGMGINTDDYMDGSDNTITFYTAALYMDDSIQAEVRLDDIGYDETRYINAYVDYKSREQKKIWLQLLFRLSGNNLAHIYEQLNDPAYRGSLHFQDKKTHKIKIEITDDKANVSTVVFYLRANTEHKEDPFTINEGHKWQDNNEPDKMNRRGAALGDNISMDNEDVKFNINSNQLYDKFHFEYSHTTDTINISDRYMLHHSYVPVHSYFDLSIKPHIVLPFELRDKVVMKYSDGKEEDGKAAKLSDGGWYKASVRNLGTYWLAVDTTAPIVKSMQKNGNNLSKANRISFISKDAMTSVRTFRGLLDGKWICFEQHGEDFFYEFDEHCPKGKHTLVFKASDENNNTRTFTLNFTR